MKRALRVTPNRLLVALLALTPCIAAHAQNSAFVGDWEIVTTGLSFIGGGTTYLHLTVEERDGELEAYVYNGPVPFRVDGREFVLEFDWSSAFDVDYVATLEGSLSEDGVLQGELLHDKQSNFIGRPQKNGNFTGRRVRPPEAMEELPPSPVDFSGLWNRAFALSPIEKRQYAMTPQGQAVIDSYLEMDNANSRCASPGLVLGSGLPYPMEILHTEDYIVLVYGADYARRIYLDNREFPDTASSSSFGFSKGAWIGETLIVTTTQLNAAFMSTYGQPVSENAMTVEHFYFDRKGYLHADMWLHDPQNYTRPPYLRRVYDRDFSPSVITKVDCDPYSFFRALDLEGELDTLWERSEYRR